MSSFYIKTLHRFQAIGRFTVLEHILNFNHCRVFKTNPTFPLLNIIHFSEQSLLAYLTKSITESKNYHMKTI